MTQTYIRNGTVLDCTGGKPVSKGAVLIEDQKITAVGSEAKIGKPGKDAVEIDAKNGFILPGLIDCHVHLAMQDYSLEKALMTPFSYNFYNAMQYFRNTVMAGVTSVRDAGGVDLGMKKAVEDGLFLGPRVKISINALSITSGHGDSWMPSGIDPNQFAEYPGMPDSRCDGVDQVRLKVRQMLRAGAEVIKICSTGGVMSPTDRPEYTQFSPEELRVIVQEAEYHGGVKVMSHAEGLEGIKNAVKAGIFSIEHGIYLDDEAVQMMLESGTYLVPTLLAPYSLLEKTDANAKLPAYMIKKAEEVYEAHRKSIGMAYKAGVKIAMGTDSGVMPHGRNLEELGLYADLGMSPMEALLTATRTAADVLGWQDKVGTLEAGKLADVIICQSDPLEDIHKLANNDDIRLVVLNGKTVKNIL
jgi:imidazolonepropionase-like amidohydrolase